MTWRVYIAALAFGLLGYSPANAAEPISEYDLAQYDLALAHLRGHGVARDEYKGAELLEAAARGGNALAQLDLSALYRTGRGVSRNEDMALKWLTEAATQGLSAAQFHLARAYHTADMGTDLDLAKAAKWYEAAATQGHVAAQVALAGLYQAGDGVAESKAMALAWYHEAASESRTAQRLSAFLKKQMSEAELAAARAINLNALSDPQTNILATR